MDTYRVGLVEVAKDSLVLASEIIVVYQLKGEDEMPERLEEIAEQVLADQIGKIMEAPADSAVVKANLHLLDPDGFGVAVGELSLAGVLWYALDCTLVVKGSSTCVVSFNATGFSWDVGAFTSQVVGTWLVDPCTTGGKCHFTCVVVDVGEGVVTFSLFSEHGKLYGTFVGDTEGADVADIHGTGTLSVS